jgi:hypothetical protein
MCLAPVIGPGGPAPKGITTQGKRWAEPRAILSWALRAHGLETSKFLRAVMMLNILGIAAMPRTILRK